MLRHQKSFSDITKHKTLSNISCYFVIPPIYFWMRQILFQHRQYNFRNPSFIWKLSMIFFIIFIPPIQFWYCNIFFDIANARFFNAHSIFDIKIMLNIAYCFWYRHLIFDTSVYFQVSRLQSWYQTVFSDIENWNSDIIIEIAISQNVH